MLPDLVMLAKQEPAFCWSKESFIFEYPHRYHVCCISGKENVLRGGQTFENFSYFATDNLLS